jgi:hypothetical protein
MFNRLFSKPKPVSNSIRETLFGDMPLNKWPAEETNQIFPWSAFITARNHIANSSFENAIEQWKKILATANLESRHYVQAWNFLRQNGQQPTPAIAKDVLGVVVEVGMPTGLDLLAAYADHSARYYNFSGAGVVWEHPDSSLDSAIDALLSDSAQVVGQIGPWDQDRPPSPQTGQMRISFLTPSGLHFGQAPMQTLASDPLSGRVVQLATTLMQMLIAKTNKLPS